MSILKELSDEICKLQYKGITFLSPHYQQTIQTTSAVVVTTQSRTHYNLIV